MSKNAYEVLGLTEGASREEVDAAYHVLRDKYRKEMYQDGALGKAAAQRLNEVEDAYRWIASELPPQTRQEPLVEEPQPARTETAQQSRPTTRVVGEAFAEVDRLLKAGDYKGAQQALDEVTRRNAEWHYYQSVIYYKKGWLNESRNQLELAVNMEPDNTHYQEVLERLKVKIAQGKVNPPPVNPQAGSQQQDGSYRSYQEQDNASYAEDSACACCQSLLCLNCMCNCCFR